MNDRPEYKDFSGTHERFEEMERRYSEDNMCVAIVGMRDDGAYTYYIYKWDTSDWEYLGEGYWTPMGVGGLFDNFHTAQKEAYSDL